MDITSHHRRERHAVEVLATVTHDIRNYLQGILGCTEVLLEEQELGEPFKDTELLRQIRRNAIGAHLLVANYLDLSRIEAGLLSLTMQPLRLGELLAQIGARYAADAQRKQITLEWQPPQRLPFVWGDDVALERVFSNLAHNAMKFTPAQGRVTLNAAHHERELAISVTDTGCGIAPADLSEIFAKGWGAAANGSIRGAGLGLFIVKTLVEAHTGRISVESTLGQGSCFTVFLPCESA